MLAAMQQEAALPKETASPSRAVPEAEALRDVVRLLGGEVSGLGAAEAAPVAVRRMAAGSALVHEGEALHSLYVVRCGSFKCVRMEEDGYEQVSALSMPGDVLGFDGLHAGQHTATVVALELSTVHALPLAGLDLLRQRYPGLDAIWQRALSRQQARAAAIADMLSAVASDVRLARFLLWFSARVTELGRSPSRLRLSMGRRDLASLLGVAHETVSRSFTTMAEAGLLRVDNREVEILDLEQLQCRARSTRRPAEPIQIALPCAAKPMRPRPAEGRWREMRQALAER